MVWILSMIVTPNLIKDPYIWDGYKQACTA